MSNQPVAKIGVDASGGEPEIEIYCNFPNGIHELYAVSPKEAELMKVCEAFIKDQRIHCPETIYQTDHVIENAYGFISRVCDIVGYHQEEE